MRSPLGPLRLQRLVRDRRGASAVEFALIAPVLCLLLAGLIDGSRFIIQTMQVRAAAQAGADFALDHTFSAAGVQNAVLGATSLSLTASNITAIQAQRCVASGILTGVNCPNNATAGNYVIVAVQQPFQPMMTWPGLGAFSQITAQAQVRVG